MKLPKVFVIAAIKLVWNSFKHELHDYVKESSPKWDDVLYKKIDEVINEL